MNEKLARFVTDNPKKVILFSFIIIVLLVSGIPKIHVEEDIKDMLPKDIPSRMTLNKLEEIFGGSDVALIGIGNEKETIFNVNTLKKIRAITDSLDVMDGINRATSLATIKYIEGHDWGLEVTPYLEEDPETAEDADRIRDMFYRDSTYVGILVSEDGKYTSIIAQLAEDAEVGKLHGEIVSLRDKFRSGNDEIYMAGMPVVQTVLSQRIKKDFRRLIPFVIALIIVLLYVSFRSITGVILPLSAVIMSLLSMVGIMGHLHIPFTTFNNFAPIILLGIGIDYGIHMMANYQQELVRLGGRKKAVQSAVTDLFVPMSMACLTTVAGFMSLMMSPLEAHHEFGYVVSIGISMALIFNLTFVPAFLTILPEPRGLKTRRESGLLTEALDALGKFVIRFRHGFAIVAVLIVIAAVFGIPKVNLEMNPISFFPDDTEIVRSDKMVNEHLAGSINMNLLFEGNIQSTEIMNAMDSLQTYIEGFEDVGSTMSLATVVKKINKSLNNNDPAYDVIPQTDAGVAQAILMYSLSGEPDDFESIVDNSFEYGQVIAMLKSISTKKVTQITDKIHEYINEKLPENDFTVETTGFMVFFKDLATLIITGQVRSITFAVLLVLIIAWLTYRRFILGLLAIIPFAMCVIFNFSIMGFGGIDLSIPTAMMSSMIIGIGVDFSFHLISRFNMEVKDGDAVQGVLRSIHKVGEPILYSAFTTACGGMVLMVSGFIPVRYLGAMLALIMLVCAFLALTVLASLLTYTKPAKRI